MSAAKMTRVFCVCVLFINTWARAEELSIRDVAGQPLAANVLRVIQSLDYLGTPLPKAKVAAIKSAAERRDAKQIQQLLDPHVLFGVDINPETRVKVRQGPAPAKLQQAGFTPLLVKVHNASTATKRLRLRSPQAGPVYAGASRFILARQQQTDLLDGADSKLAKGRFLSVAMFQDPPMKRQLSGLKVEYAIALIYSQEFGKREATIGFDIGQGTEDIGFRGQVPVLFDVRRAVRVKLKVHDEKGRASIARLLFRDKLGRVYPAQALRLAPDFFFQPHIYRASDEFVYLPPGKLSLQASRGPEYIATRQEVEIPDQETSEISIQLKRWIDPMNWGFYSGDHHIHAAGCSHYQSPTQGVTPADMFRQVKGEGLNVGCVLTWGPCYDFQRQYFSPKAHTLSQPETILKYDLEISGFGSQALGHVCLLDLKDQTYPGSDGTSTKGWPTWTTPVLKWAKKQGGVVGYAHSASGLMIDPQNATRRLLSSFDRDGDKRLEANEVRTALLPESLVAADRDGDKALSEAELIASHQRASAQLPNYAIPEMNGVGAMEIGVSAVAGACDFISAMDTARIQEWNTWYHLLNCGFPIKVSGETDFPCMSSRRVGQGRVYVQLDKQKRFNFSNWCRGLAAGKSYVSDGFAHPVEFQVHGAAAGDNVELKEAGQVSVDLSVAFAKAMPLGVAQGGVVPNSGRQNVGDTILLHQPRHDRMQVGGQRWVEVIVNGEVAARRQVPADGKLHRLKFQVLVKQSSWVAVRNFPQFHTNPVNVLVANRPIRASGKSARWMQEMVKLLWKNREKRILPAERGAAKQAFDAAIKRYGEIAKESPRGS